MSKKLQITPSRPIITASEINKHLSDPDNIHWVLMDQLMDDTPEQCVDGRSSTGIIGTPGGNMGEFILALHAAELVTNKTTTNTQVSHIFKNYLLRFNAFYMHTDTHALDHLKEELNKNNLFKNIPTKTTKDIEKLIRKPNPSIQSTLLEYLINPANIGCGHIKLMLSHPDEYSVRPKLIRSAIKAYFQALWEDTKLDYTVLAADHAEAAVLTVLIEDKKITTKTMVPTVVSMGKTTKCLSAIPK